MMKIAMWAAMLVLSALALPLQAAPVSWYLSLPGITGSGSQPGYPGLVPLDSPAFQFSNSTLDARKLPDSNTTLLQAAQENATFFPAINLYEFDTDSAPGTLFGTYRFSNATIVGYSLLAPYNGGTPLENWAIQYGSYTFTPAAPVPLPAAAWLLLSGLSGLGLMARKRNRRELGPAHLPLEHRVH